MKKYFFLNLIFAILLLSSCELKPNQDDLGTPTPTDQDQPTISEGTIYELGYGDYVTHLDGDYNSTVIKKEYNNLQTKISKQYNQQIISNYEKGLLDFFDIQNKIIINIEIEDSELQKMNNDYLTNNRESYRVCNINITMNNLLFHYENVGIRQKGNTSRKEVLTDDGKLNQIHYKLSFTEDFTDEFRTDKLTWTDNEALNYRKKRDFFGLDKLILRWNRNQDSTYIKEYYAYEMYRANGVLAPHSNPINVTISTNNTTQNLGVYLALEDVNKKFIEKNLDSNLTGGDLYKLGWTHGGATLDSTDSKLFGVEYQIKSNDRFETITYNYDLKTNKKTSTHTAIKNFINNITSTSSTNFDTMLNNNTIYDSLINYFAVSYLLGDPDDLRGNFNNTYLYFTSEGKALFIPTDNDRSLGSTGGTGNPTNHHGAQNKPFDNFTGYSENHMPLFTKSIIGEGNQKTKENYLQKILSIIESGWFRLDNFEKYYNYCKKNYSSYLTLGNKINGNLPTFSLNEATNLSDGWNLSIETYINTKTNVINNFDSNNEEIFSSLYLRGSFNNWGVSNDYNLKIIDGIPTIEIYISNTEKFKIADSNWGFELNYTNLSDNSLFNSIGENKNIAVKESGTYIIKVINYNEENTYLLIEKKSN